jgi:hypothetical protein
MSESWYLDDPAAVRSALQPLLAGDLSSWEGLPRLSAGTLRAALGQPEQVEEATLGWYPAQRHTFLVEAPGGGLDAYIRNNDVVLVETLTPPPLSAMSALEEPSAIKPHEILREGSYVHEYLYCEIGLVLSIAEPFDKNQSLRIVRCRGIQPIDDPDQFGPQFYMPFEERSVW